MDPFRRPLYDFNRFLDRHLTVGVKWLILANTAVFLTEAFLVVPFGVEDRFFALFAQNPLVSYEQTPLGGVALKINWLCTMQFFTYMFVHANFWHLFWNMLALWFFGPPMEYRWGTVAFLKFYCFTGFAAGALHGLLAPFFVGSHYMMMGASGAIFGVLLAFAIYYPHQQILLWFVIPVPARVLVALIGIFTFLSLVGGARTNISHLTHLAGLGFGYLWIRLHEAYPRAWLFNNDAGPLGSSRGSFGRWGGWG